MLIVKGFVTINDYINNVPNITSSIGELSTWSRTYSKNNAEYQHMVAPGLNLVVFSSVDSVTNNEVILSDIKVQTILSVIKTCINYSLTNTRPFNTTNFLNNILSEHSQIVGTINIGSFVDNGITSVPAWISWTDVDSSDYVKIWLSDQAFSDQYDQYQIEVIPTLPNVDDFFANYSNVVAAVDAVTTQDLVEKINVVKGDDPETYVKILGYEFHNLLNSSQKKTVDWGILIYGKAGDNIDSIKDAIIQYVITNSTRTLQQWALIFPDIFKRTEFVILPRWDKISIPNLTQNSALYSSVLDARECIEFAKTAIDFYPDAHIEYNTNIMPYDYKAVSLVIVNGKDNVSDNALINVLFSDYIPVNTTSYDFNRQSIKTQEWSTLIERLLITAETATPSTTLPFDFRRVMRNTTLYIAVVYKNVNYLVAAKYNTFYNL